MLEELSGAELFFELLSEELEILYEEVSNGFKNLPVERLPDVLSMLEEFLVICVEWDRWDLVDIIENLLEKVNEKLEMC